MTDNPWDDYGREGSQRRRANNREGSAEMLTGAGIAFETKNAGAHLIVRHAGRVVDFWPGTGKWIERGTGLDKRGVRPLISHLKRAEQEQS